MVSILDSFKAIGVERGGVMGRVCVCVCVCLDVQGYMGHRLPQPLERKFIANLRANERVKT